MAADLPANLVHMHAQQSGLWICRCESCGKRGATIGCRDERCNRSYHLTCALRGAATLYPAHYLLACPAHAKGYGTSGYGHVPRRLRHVNMYCKLATSHAVPSALPAGLPCTRQGLRHIRVWSRASTPAPCEHVLQASHQPCCTQRTTCWPALRMSRATAHQGVSMCLAACTT